MTTNMTKEGQLAKMWPGFIGFLYENFEDELEMIADMAIQKGLITEWKELEALLLRGLEPTVIYNHLQNITENYIKPTYEITLEKYPDEEQRLSRPLHFFSLALPATLEEMQGLPKFTELKEYGKEINELVVSLASMGHVAIKLTKSVELQKQVGPRAKNYGKALEKLYRYLEYFMTLVGCI